MKYDKMSKDEQMRQVLYEAARNNLFIYARLMKKNFATTQFHKNYYKVLDMFAKGEIKKLIVTIPPQTGKSQGSSRFLPSYMLGRNPNLKIFIGSYSADLAKGFNADVQKLMQHELYEEIFPTRLSNGHDGYKKNSDTTECVGYEGSLFVAGRGGSLTGKTVNVAILDDLYKDYQEACSPTIREAAWDWYTSVVKTRLDNNAQELIVYTRWHEEDVVGRLEGIEEIRDIESWEDTKNVPNGTWLRINFEAIKESEPTEIDPRQKGDVLWPEKHSYETLMAKRKLDKVKFDCLYQGHPGTKEGILYQPFRTWKEVGQFGYVIGKGNCTDCADTGEDNLCSIDYYKVQSTELDESGYPIVYLLVRDIIYTDEAIEVTTEIVPQMFNRDRTDYAHIESNNGGHAFSLIVQNKTQTKINWFTQSQNKEGRIVSNAGLVTRHIIMPEGWEEKYPRFHKDVTKFKRKFSANKHDDAPDVLTTMIEKEINLSHNFGLRRIN